MKNYTKVQVNHENGCKGCINLDKDDWCTDIETRKVKEPCTDFIDGNIIYYIFTNKEQPNEAN